MRIPVRGIRGVMKLALLTGAMVTACAVATRMNQLGVGMTEKEVVGIMGDPDLRQKQGSYEGLKWERGAKNFGFDNTDYWVLLKDGRVQAYGPGQVRKSGDTLLVFVPHPR